MDIFVRAYVIPYIGTLTKVKTKAQVWLVLDMYFDELMCIATILDLVIKEDTMHKYVVHPTTLKTMMFMLLYELDRRSWVVYLDAMEVRVRFEKDVTLEYMTPSQTTKLSIHFLLSNTMRMSKN